MAEQTKSGAVLAFVILGGVAVGIVVVGVASGRGAGAIAGSLAILAAAIYGTYRGMKGNRAARTKNTE